MSKPVGNGIWLLLLDYGLDGWAVHRFATEKELREALVGGETYGEEFIVAKEMKLKIGEESDG